MAAHSWRHNRCSNVVQHYSRETQDKRGFHIQEACIPNSFLEVNERTDGKWDLRTACKATHGGRLRCWEYMRVPGESFLSLDVAREVDLMEWPWLTGTHGL